MKKTALTFVLLIIAIIGFAKPIALAPHHPDRYVVKSGDTLWGIANKFLQKPWQWKQLWHGNADIKNPNLIYPGDVLTLNLHNGHYVLSRSGGTVILKPGIKTYQLTEAIPVIPFSDIKPFIQGIQVVSRKQMQQSAYIIALENNAQMVGTPSQIFAMKLHWPLRRYFSIFREGSILRDPITKKILGIDATHVADARLVHEGRPATLMLKNVYQEVQPKDRILPMPARLSPSDFYPQAPKVIVEGQIILLLGEASVTGQHNVVIIDRGLANGIQRGDVLAIYKDGPIVADPVKKAFFKHGVKMPDERVGEMIIFRAFNHVSFGLITESTKIIEKFDMVTNPTS